MNDDNLENFSDELVIGDNQRAAEKNVLGNQLAVKKEQFEKSKSVALQYLNKFIMQCNSPNVTSSELKIMVDALKNLLEYVSFSISIRHSSNSFFGVNNNSS